MRRLTVLLAVLTLALPPALAVAGRRADERLLRRLHRVHGPGSGLDADTLRGLTPEQITAQACPDVAERLAGLEARLAALEATAGAPPPGGGVSRARLYARARRAVLSAGEEQHLYADCNEPGHLALSCSGGAIRGATESPVTWMGVVQGDGATTLDRCLVVVTAGTSAPTTEIDAEVRCLQLP